MRYRIRSGDSYVYGIGDQLPYMTSKESEAKIFSEVADAQEVALKLHRYGFVVAIEIILEKKNEP